MVDDDNVQQLLTLHQDATSRATHGPNLTACARDTVGLTQTSTEWYWLKIKTVYAETSNPPVTSSITVLFWPFHAAWSTPPTKTWLNIFAILSLRPNRIVLPPVSQLCVYDRRRSNNCRTVSCSNNWNLSDQIRNACHWNRKQLQNLNALCLNQRLLKKLDNKNWTELWHYTNSFNRKCKFA